MTAAVWNQSTQQRLQTLWEKGCLTVFMLLNTGASCPMTEKPTFHLIVQMRNDQQHTHEPTAGTVSFYLFSGILLFILYWVCDRQTHLHTMDFFVCIVFCLGNSFQEYFLLTMKSLVSSVIDLKFCSLCTSQFVLHPFHKLAKLGLNYIFFL